MCLSKRTKQIPSLRLVVYSVLWSFLFMRYLYFQPRTTPKVNTKWLPHHQTVLSLINQITKTEDLKQIHGQMMRTSLIQDTFLVSRIITFLTIPSTLFNTDYARRVFDQIQYPNLFIWNSMIRCYTQNYAMKDAFLLFKHMFYRGYAPDSHTYTIMIKVCSHFYTLELDKMLHGMIMKSGYETDLFVMSGFVNLYASYGRLEVARKIFDNMPARDVVSWTTMISGYAQLNCSEESFLLFDEMRRAGVEPNKVTIVSLLSACGNLRDPDRGVGLHNFAVDNKMENDIVIGNALVNMYAKCGNMSKALEVFHKIPTRNEVSWNSLIGGFTQNGLPREALKYFHEMEVSDVRPNKITMVSALSACAQLGELEQGRLLHKHIEENRLNYDIFVGNALINMYSKCGELEGALDVFRQMLDTDIFSWTSLITGYVQGSKLREALDLFQEMQFSGVIANEVTLVSLLSACAQLGALDQGKLIHTYIEEHNVKRDVCLGNSLVDMYAKCGSIQTALRIFHSMPRKDTFSWNAMIGGLATHGDGREAIVLFTQMLNLGVVVPDSVTFTAVLCACTHSGMAREGLQYFKSMSTVYGITPTIEHYGCVVDLLGRAGHLEEAGEFIKNMPTEPNHIIWGSFLSACYVHRKLKLGEKVAQDVLKCAHDDEGLYVLISNIYAEAGRWDDVRKVRTLMGRRGMEKSPGHSSIEVEGVVQEFHVRDLMHHASGTIYLILDSLMLQASEAGYGSSAHDASLDYNKMSIDQ